MRSRLVPVAYACVFLLVSLLFEPGIAGITTAAASPAPENLRMHVASDSPDDASPPPPLVNGPPMGNGGVDSYVNPPTGSVHNVSALPLVGDTPEAYLYDTPFGNFTFSKATPHRMRLLAATGVAVDAAWFDASIPRSVEGTSEVVSRDATSYVAVHQLLVDDTAVAEIRTTFEFFSNRAPKTSATLTPNPGALSEVTWYHFAPGDSIPSWLLPFLEG